MLQKVLAHIRVILTVIMLIVIAVGMFKLGMNFTGSEIIQVSLAIYFVAMMICSICLLAVRRRQKNN